MLKTNGLYLKSNYKPHQVTIVPSRHSDFFPWFLICAYIFIVVVVVFVACIPLVALKACVHVQEEGCV